MTTTLRHAAAAGLLAATLAGGALAAAPAGADASRKVPPDLSALKARCDAAIAARQLTLTELTNGVNASVHLSAGNRAALSGQLSSAASGLAGLKAKIDGDTTVATAAADCRAIVTDYRVYLLVAPKTRLVIAADRGTAAVAAANAAQPKIEAAIAAAEGHPKVIPADHLADAKAKDADLTAKVSDASAKLAGLADQLVPLTAQQYDDGAAKPVLDAARQKLLDARTDLVAARADLHAIRVDLTPVR